MARKLDDACLQKVKASLAEYERYVRDESGVAKNTQTTYLRHANTFVRWLDGDFDPGSQVRN